jgi:predicted ATPase
MEEITIDDICSEIPDKWISEIYYRGFGPQVDYVSHTMTPLFVVCGKNGAGKSTIFKAIKHLSSYFSHESYPCFHHEVNVNAEFRSDSLDSHDDLEDGVHTVVGATLNWPVEATILDQHGKNKVIQLSEEESLSVSLSYNCLNPKEQEQTLSIQCEKFIVTFRIKNGIANSLKVSEGESVYKTTGQDLVEEMASEELRSLFGWIRLIFKEIDDNFFHIGPMRDLLPPQASIVFDSGEKDKDYVGHKGEHSWSLYFKYALRRVSTITSAYLLPDSDNIISSEDSIKLIYHLMESSPEDVLLKKLGQGLCDLVKKAYPLIHEYKYLFKIKHLLDEDQNKQLSHLYFVLINSIEAVHEKDGHSNPSRTIDYIISLQKKYNLNTCEPILFSEYLNAWIIHFFDYFITYPSSIDIFESPRVLIPGRALKWDERVIIHDESLYEISLTADILSAIPGLSDEDKFLLQLEKLGCSSEEKVKNLELFKNGKIHLRKGSVPVFKHFVLKNNVGTENADLSFDLGDHQTAFSQIFPILLQLTLTDFGTIIIENPESHLHPNLIVKFAELLMDLSTSGKYLFIETHSDDFLLRILRGVLEGRVDKEDVNLLFVDKKIDSYTLIPESDVTLFDGYKNHFYPINIDSNGQINWPEGFMESKTSETEKIVELMLKRQSENENHFEDDE